MSDTIGKVANGVATDGFAKLEAKLKEIEPRTRLAFLLGGLLATTDELRMSAAQVEQIVKTGIAQRAAVLARMRQGERILFGPDGAPLVPGAARVPEEVPTVKLGPPREAAQDVDAGPLCAFCGLTEAKGRHSKEATPNTWHSFRAAVTDAELESVARALELQRSPA